MDLRSFLAVLKRWAWLMVTGAFLAGGTAYAVSTLLAPPPTFEAEAVILVGPALTTSDANLAQMEAARRVSQIYVEVAGSRPLLERVVSALELDVPADALQGQLTVTALEEPPIITVAALASDPEQAAAIANEVTRQLIDVAPRLDGAEEQAQEFIGRQVDALEREIETLIAQVESLAERTSRTAPQDERLAGLQDRLVSLRGTYASLISASSPTAANQLTVIEEAVPDPQALPLGRAQPVLFASLLGLVLATVIALLVEHLDDKVRTAGDIRRIGQLPTLAEIESIPASEATGMLPAGFARDSMTGETFHALRTNIEFSAAKPPRSLLIASAHRAEGRSTVAANLAVALAQSGRSVLLVDADMRHPAIHRLFGMPNEQGLSDLLRSSDFMAVDLVRQTSISELRVLPAGSTSVNPVELAGASRFKAVAAELKRGVDLIIFDSPPVLSASESSVIASFTDATLLVVAAGRTSFDSLTGACDVLARAGATVIGSVLNLSSASGARPAAGALTRRSSQLPGQSLREDQSGSS